MESTPPKQHCTVNIEVLPGSYRFIHYLDHVAKLLIVLLQILLISNGICGLFEPMVFWMSSFVFFIVEQINKYSYTCKN